jgi:hypothetical protein
MLLNISLLEKLNLIIIHGTIELLSFFLFAFIGLRGVSFLKALFYDKGNHYDYVLSLKLFKLPIIILVTAAFFIYIYCSTSIISGLLLPIVFVMSWHSKNLFKINLTREKYIFGLLVIVIDCIICEVLKFLNALYYLPNELQNFNNHESLIIQLKKSIFLKESNFLDYLFYCMYIVLYSVI